MKRCIGKKAQQITPKIASLVGLWLLRTVPAFALDRLLGWGLVAVCIGILLDFSIRSILYLIRMNKGQWKYLKI